MPLSSSLLVFAALSAGAQIVVPPGGRKAPVEEGVELPGRDGERPQEARDERGDLEVPPDAPPRRENERRGDGTPPAPTPDVAGEAAEGGPVLRPPVGPAGGGAGTLLDRLAAVSDPRAPTVAAMGRELARLGEGGRSAARAALLGSHGPACVAGARALLAAGAAPDAELVLERLARPLPPGAAEPLLAAVLELDPVRASPGFLAGLLDHPDGQMRRAARKVLDARLGPEHLPHLAERLRTGSSATRAAAVELVGRIPDPAATNLLVDRLGDGRARVARRAAELLAARDGAELDGRLLELALGDGLASRRAAYALLAIVEREDRRGIALLDSGHEPELLLALRRGDPFTAGAAAVALAGIGFRSSDRSSAPWLDREVPHELVKQVSGAVFHADFSSIQEPAQRRLKLVSGQSLGADGPAWRAWWVDAASGFRAQRAVLAFEPEELVTLSVSCRTGGERGTLLLGPDAPAPARSEAAAHRVVHLTEEECADVVLILRREGVLGPERLPGSRADAGSSARELAVTIGGAEKRFRLPLAPRTRGAAAEEEDWFEAVAAAVRAIDERNRWQRFPVPGRHASQRALWEEAHAEWAETRPERERALALKALVLDHLAGVRSDDRLPGLDELERLFADGAAEPADFGRLRALLEDEVLPGPRAERLVALAIQAGLTAGEEGELPEELGSDLVRLLTKRFGEDAAPSVGRVLAAAGPELARAEAQSDDAAVRALAAAALGSDGSPESRAVLFELFADRHPDVEAAAVTALAEAGVVEAREEVLRRAREARGRVRRAALRAAGVLCEPGDGDALDALVRALAEPDPTLQGAAAEGLAELADPRSAPLLASLLARGPGAAVFAPARRALAALGDEATTDLLRLASSGADEARREAALLLAEAGVPQAAPLLIALLTERPGDARVAQELAVLTGVDLRGADEPAREWWTWWDGVVHDDALAWFRAACERVGFATPPAEELRGAGTRDAALFLVEAILHGEPHVAERARRELARRLGRDVAPLSTAAEDREERRRELLALVDERWPGR